jgi:transcriptional regulator with XRE-family HTH domain
VISFEPAEIGARLREERARLALRQDEFATVMGVSATTQGNYERGDRSPGADYLALASQRGIDVGYVVTGARVDATNAVTAEEAYLLGNYRACTDANKQELLEASAVLANPPPKKPAG